MSSEPEGNSKPEPAAANGSNRELAVSPANGVEPRRKAANSAGIQPIHGIGTVALKPEFVLYRAIRNGLRGRMLWAIGLGILVGALGAYVGSRLGRPMYESTGLVQIAYELPKVMTETDQNGPMQMFDTYMQSQKILITSRSFLEDNATGQPDWKKLGEKAPADAISYFSKHLTVTVTPHSEYIQITVSDPDPYMAEAAASAVYQAYINVFNENAKTTEEKRTTALSEISGPIKTQIDQKSADIDQITAKYDTSDLSGLYDANFAQFVKTSGELDDVKMAIAAAAPDESLSTTQPSSTQPTSRPIPDAVAELTVEQIAARDTKMQAYLDQEKDLQNQLKIALLNVGESNPSIVALKARIEQAHSQVEEYADSYRKFSNSLGQSLSNPGNVPISLAGRSLESLRASEKSLRELLAVEQGNLRSVGRDRMLLEQMNAERAALKDQYDKVQTRGQALNGESHFGSRLNDVSGPGTPSTPTTDPRLKIASVGALAGAVLPAILLVLQSLVVSGRYKYSDDAHVSGAADIPLLGIVPSLNPAANAGRELSHAAAQSIHQIRVSLTSDATNGAESNAYLVTSASAGEGKTSLCMSIGLSFAGSGVRTLLIDCDMLGRQITECLGALDKPGLQEALGSGTLHSRILKASRKLYYVPTGQVARADACSISPARLRLILAQARRHFDVVLIDSGPILGSVEASVLAREVDGVLFAVSQNQRRAVVERAIQRLASLDARLDGLIFNRARPEDFESSSYGSSSGRSTISWRSNGHHVEEEPPPEGKFAQFGPLVQAVASTMHRNAALEKSTAAKT